ncbi:MAG: hypothetical protein LBT45_01895 [Rickettsiales bacterium]|jgi:hypothetical protein|nr:hypothetical protein [Rickettsiales bacterium]
MKGIAENILESCSVKDLQRYVKSQEKKIKKAFDWGDSLVVRKFVEDYKILKNNRESMRGIIGKKTCANIFARKIAHQNLSMKIKSFFATYSVDDLKGLVESQSRAILRRFNPDNIEKLSRILTESNVLTKVLGAGRRIGRRR